jgi:hypothetical protein
MNESPADNTYTFKDLKCLGIVNHRSTLLAWIKNNNFPPGRKLDRTEHELCQWLYQWLMSASASVRKGKSGTAPV